ncbi:unnamed protein product [Ranitomeya imitator]|uniref:Uncharacterized protein n=1 Tax=Ranitomeya imitator TaxID=111125 RepID=A0ABN9M5F3_9NEOB|nr:unnamed protein product [Ranitomeya imitator]
MTADNKVKFRPVRKNELHVAPHYPKAHYHKAAYRHHKQILTFALGAFQLDELLVQLISGTLEDCTLHCRYRSLREQRKPFINMVMAYGSAFIILPAFSFGMNTEVSLRTLYSLEDFDMNNRVVFFNPQYLKNLTSYWKRIGLKFRRMSSGLLLASAAFEVCEKVTLYGFWPFSEDLEGTPIPHHYYDNVPPKPGFHSMSDEFYQYLIMHSQGALKLQLGQC